MINLCGYSLPIITEKGKFKKKPHKIMKKNTRY